MDTGFATALVAALATVSMGGAGSNQATVAIAAGGS
jgi:hypothetical protein